MSYQPGEQIGDYQILDILGGGGMGAVYKVRNVLSGRVEAMKVVLENLQGNAEVLDRFLREIRVLASLEHPNIAALRTAQRVEGQILMIMELVEGETLQSMLSRGRLPLAQAVRYVRDALRGLAAAHERGIVHRDIKPANMMVNKQGELKLMDFGIARLATDPSLTKTGLTLGSLYYMSPEQISGSEIDARADIYSMGITLYQLVTGKRPFEGTSEFSIMAAHMNQAPTPPIELDPALPADLNAIIMMALEKDPAKRFGNATAMGNALERILEQVGGAKTAPAPAPHAAAPTVSVEMAPAAPQPARQGSGKRLLYVLAGSLATVALLVIAAIQIPKWRSTRAGEPPQEIQTPLTQQETAPAPAAPEPRAETAPAPQEPATQTPPPPAAQPAARTPVVQNPPPARVSQPAARTASPASQPEPQVMRAPEPPPAAPQQAAPAPAQPARNGAALSEARERLMLMSTRVGPVRQTLDRMRQQQARMGVGLRQDLASMEQRLIFRLDEAERAINAGDAARADQQLDAAERELTALEKALGR